MHIIIEGLDHIGKDTLINVLQDTFGGRTVHSVAPKLCTYYKNEVKNYKPGASDNEALYKYQAAYFSNMVNSIVGNIKETEESMKFYNISKHNQYHVYYNRFHLGEYVYGKIYRNYDESKLNSVFYYERELYKKLSKDQFENVYLILLKMHHPENRTYDDDAFNFNNWYEEQELFDKAFNMSILRKSVVYVDTKYGAWRPVSDIADEVKTLAFA